MNKPGDFTWNNHIGGCFGKVIVVGGNMGFYENTVAVTTFYSGRTKLTILLCIATENQIATTCFIFSVLGKSTHMLTHNL